MKNPKFTENVPKIVPKNVPKLPMKNRQLPCRKEMSERIADDVDVSLERLQELAKITDETYVVLNHGDTWSSNLMFKYSPLDETMPIAMR